MKNNVEALAAIICQAFCMKAHEKVMDLDSAEPANSRQEYWLNRDYDVACEVVQAFDAAGIVPQF